MGLFDFFKRRPTPEPALIPAASPAREALATARQYYQAADYPAALKALAQGFQQDVEFRPLYELAIDTLSQLGAVDEQQLFRAALREFHRPEPFAQLGGYFVGQMEQSYYELAEPFLRKALNLAPDNVDVAHDLALCYARRFQVARALEELARVPYQQDFWVWYFYQKLSILNGQVADVPAALAATAAEMPADVDPIILLKIKELREMVTRCQAVAQPRQHIRDWQFIQYGGAVLNYFEAGDDEYVAGGRYVALWLSPESIKGVLVALRQLLTALDAPVQAVAALPDRDSQIVAAAAALELGLPLLDYEPATAALPLLVVAADSSAFGEYAELATVQPGQVLFALNHHWLQPARLAPDVIGLMSQLGGLPWDGSGMRLVEGEGEKHRVEHVPVDKRPAGEIAREIVAAVPANEAAPELEFYRRHRAYLKGFGTDAGPHRFNFMVESPVPGSYFN